VDSEVVGADDLYVASKRREFNYIGTNEGTVPEDCRIEDVYPKPKSLIRGPKNVFRVKYSR
jgi:hypothetical protein